MAQSRKEFSYSDQYFFSVSRLMPRPSIIKLEKVSTAAKKEKEMELQKWNLESPLPIS
jgi:hypothetical protein